VKLTFDTSHLQATGNRDIELSSWPTDVDAVYQSARNYRDLLANHIHHMKSYQERLYAENKHAILILFQAMDAAGKDGAIKHVMSGVNPQGCQVSSFKQPSQRELKHDFLWRAVACLPELGQIGIFNRSYYEDVLVARVHSDGFERSSHCNETSEESLFWERRYQSIRDFESHLQSNGTCVIKIFLHISKEEQRSRLLARIDKPHKQWKIRPEDLQERKYWNRYMSAYEECIKATSTKQSPWYLVPADNKKNARLIVSQILCEAFCELNPDFPVLSESRKHQVESFRELLSTH
jgi:PPK2 family polyphosphate:nucleotide phosphotransferase